MFCRTWLGFSFIPDVEVPSRDNERQVCLVEHGLRFIPFIPDVEVPSRDNERQVCLKAGLFFPFIPGVVVWWSLAGATSTRYVP
mgnify:CR=1 FL=1